jgi:hypothetical protein
MKVLLSTVLALSLMFSGCSAMKMNAPIQHPGAVDKIDDNAYTALLVYDDAIKSAKGDLTAGTLPDAVKPVLNKFIDGYNVLQAATTAYHNAALAGPVPADVLQKVSDAEAAAAAAFAELVKIYPKAGAKK